MAKNFWQKSAGSPQLYFTQDKWWTTETEYNELKQLAKEEINNATQGIITIQAELNQAKAEIERLKKEAAEQYAAKAFTCHSLFEYPSLATENKQLRKHISRLEDYQEKQGLTIKSLQETLRAYETRCDTSRRKDFNPEFWDWVTTNTGWLCVFRRKD